jgi:hypothetical protein
MHADRVGREERVNHKRKVSDGRSHKLVAFPLLAFQGASPRPRTYMAERSAIAEIWALRHPLVGELKVFQSR